MKLKRKLDDMQNEGEEVTPIIGQVNKCDKNMDSSSISDPYVVDEIYFSALHDDEEIFPISDEKYAEELQLQEALMSSASVTSENTPSSSTQNASKASGSGSGSASASSSALPTSPKKPVVVALFCDICMDTKTPADMFQNTNGCGHLFCSDCIREHVAAKIKENLIEVTCPAPNCRAVIGPEVCRSIVPQEVLERWESILCESVIRESDKFYCPFKDCSAMLLDDGGESVTSSECPNCNRLFCAQCKVAWHSDISCIDFQARKRGEPSSDDLLLINLAKNKSWMKCPYCKFYVEKTEGCLHILCRCGHHFCYGCGQPYDSSHACATV